MVPDDFYAFIGFFIYLGYSKIPRYRLMRLMWKPTSLCYDPVISEVFSHNIFESFLAFLYVVEDNEKKLIEFGDKLCKVRPLNNHIMEKCQELYQPHCEVSIDEQMVRSKARFSFRQNI
uniref:PiggyBac transposable element-derived protein domain-containing protein n=1 Tax=Amphimedon queenslandica TaxID=400682 RepID=A0A1X7TL80_AMPQE